MSRHEMYPDFSAEQLEKLERLIGNDVAAVATRTPALNSLLSNALRHLGHRCAVDPRGSNGDTWDSLLFATRVGAAIFAVATAEPGTTVVLDLGRRSVAATATGPEYFTSATNWLTAMWMAHAARDEATIQRLAEVPLDLLRAADDTEPEYALAMVDLLGRFVRQERGVAEALDAALRATDPAGLHPLRRDYVLKIVVPQLDVFHHLADEPDGFNQALVAALELHKEYWTRTDEDADSPFGFIAPGLLALASFAHDTGTPVDVRSDYLPLRVLDGTWVRERG
ncbi:MAG: immunity 49 family protein [Actinomycetota bacterium]|nr:immunity 49 family protein [Actinomycetota bacterium]